MPTDAIRGRRLERYPAGNLVGTLNKTHENYPPEWAFFRGKLYHLETFDGKCATYYEEPDFEDMGS
jgi:hypothetical protein